MTLPCHITASPCPILPLPTILLPCPNTSEYLSAVYPTLFCISYRGGEKEEKEEEGEQEEEEQEEL